jgi:hypothetical protein
VYVGLCLRNIPYDINTSLHKYLDRNAKYHNPIIANLKKKPVTCQTYCIINLSQFTNAFILNNTLLNTYEKYFFF